MKSKRWLIAFLVVLCYCQASEGYGLNTDGYDRIAHVGQKTVTVPLSDDFNHCPDGSAKVYLLDANGTHPVTLLDFSVDFVTVTRIGEVVNVTLGDGNPFNNLFWRQEVDQSGGYGTLVIEFTGTKAESWIANGGNHIVLGVPSGDVPNVSTPCVVQVYSDPSRLEIYPTAGTFTWPGKDIENNSSMLLPQAWYSTGWPAGSNAVPSFSITFHNTDACRN